MTVAARVFKSAREPLLATASGAAAFTAAGLLLDSLGPQMLDVVVGAGCLALVVLLARRWGIAYASPVAIAVLVAFDWFALPPTRQFGVPSSADAVTLTAYIAGGVLIGQLAQRALRRAASSERARTALGDEQAALRRLATRVARGESSEAIFSAVAREVGELFRMDGARVVHFVSDDEVFEHAGWQAPGHPRPPSGPTGLETHSLAAAVRETGRAVLVDDYASLVPDPEAVGRRLGIRSGMAAPIVVDGRLWGAVTGWWRQRRRTPDDAMERLAAFTELVATAISRAASHEQQTRLAREQAALRRVATLVASEPAPAEVLDAVVDELWQLLAIDNTFIYRYGPDETATIVAGRGPMRPTLFVGATFPTSGRHVMGEVRRAGRPVRIDDFSNATGTFGETVRDLGTRCAVGAPIVVEGRLWGAIIVSTTRATPLPPSTESRVADFTELVAMAISNVEARAALAESRARIVVAGDEERRRVVRDLHDGAQQRLVHTVITLTLAQNALDGAPPEAVELVGEALDHAKRANTELRELAHGILPAVLNHGGLPAAVDALAARMPMPVDVDVTVERLPQALEAAAYFVLAESLTNVAKHARATRAAVTAHAGDGTLHVAVRDDGVGGARADGSGLVGLADRVAALKGRVRIETHNGEGTHVVAEIPVPG